jgi:hypothetical protein
MYVEDRKMFYEYARMGEGRSVYRVLVGMPEGNRPLGRPKQKWEDDIKWTSGR